MKDSHHDVGVDPKDAHVNQSYIVNMHQRVDGRAIEIPAKKVKRIEERKLRGVVERNAVRNRIDPVRKFSSRKRPRNVREERKYEMGIVGPRGCRVFTVKKSSQERPEDHAKSARYNERLTDARMPMNGRIKASEAL